MIKKQKKLYISTTLIVFIIALLFLGAFLLVRYENAVKKERLAREKNLNEEINAPAPESLTDCSNFNLINGECLAADQTDYFFYAVMIDNHVAARPNLGVSQASLVYEVVVESPITRLLAIFPSYREIDKIGPIRSARPFFIDWAKEIEGPYVHVGGSNEAIESLKKYQYDLNEFYNGQIFWRDYNRISPHQVFTASENINKFVIKNDWQMPDKVIGAWQFKEDLPLTERSDNQEIKIDYIDPDFFVKWEYDKENNNYIRYQGGRKIKDGADDVRAKNVAIMYTDSKTIDNYGRRQTKTTGFGKAIIFQDGVAIDGKWERKYLSDRTRFFASSGEEIKFNRGQTWIEVIFNNWPEAVYE